MNSNLRKTITAVISLAWAGTAWAAPQAFDFKDPKGVNNAVFRLDAPLEAINGTATGVSGTINYDPAQPESLSGKIVFDANSLTVPNPMMKEHLHGAMWMDVAKYPDLSFEAVKADKVKREGDNTQRRSLASSPFTA